MAVLSVTLLSCFELKNFELQYLHIRSTYLMEQGQYGTNWPYGLVLMPYLRGKWEFDADRR